MDLSFKTTATGFAESVHVLVVKQLVESLRSSLPWLYPGTVLNARLIPGTNGTARFFDVTDLAAGQAQTLTEGVTPDGQDLVHDWLNVVTSQEGGFVRVTDLAIDESPFPMVAQAAAKVARQAAVRMDEIARAAYAARAADIVDATGTIAADDIINAVAIMRRRGVKPLARGYFAAVCGPELAADISRLTDFVEAVKFQDAERIHTGVVGSYRGILVVESPRDIATLSAARGSLTGDAATDILTSTAHGLKPGQRIQFATLTGGAGLVVGTDHFIVDANLTADTFQVSATRGGAAVNFTTDVTAGTFQSELKRLQVLGMNSLGYGDLSSLEILSASFAATESDPLAQRASVGWKARIGAALAHFDERDNGGADTYRTVAVEVPASYQAA